jgi:hypothetical protein
MSYRDGGKHVKMYTLKLHSSKRQVVLTGVIQGRSMISMRPEAKNYCAGGDSRAD